MPDITLANFNMLYIRYCDSVERENHLPLGPLYLARAMERAGLDVDFRDYQTWNSQDPFSIGSILDFLSDPSEIVGVSCMANLLPFAILAMREFKRRHPGCKVILGGVGPKSVEGQLLSLFPWIDIVASGEGELVAPSLVNALKSGSDLGTVPGIWYRDPTGRAIENPPPPRVENIDELGPPAFHLVNLKNYTGYGIVSSRGCPYPCSFCSVAPIWGRSPRFRSNGDIISEMRFLYESAGVNLFLFQDEFFVASKERAVSFCRDLRKSGPPVMFKAFGRVNLTDAETMEELVRAGCVELRYGVESGCNTILERTKKGFTAEQALDVVSRAATILPRVDAFYIWGFPFESMEDFYETVLHMVSLRMAGVRILPSLLCLLPQTDLFAEIGSENLEFADDLFPEYMLTGHEVAGSVNVSIRPEHQGYFDFIRAHPEIFPGFFHVDVRSNVLPKLSVLQEMGFYPAQDSRPENAESCGAHSPRLSAIARPAKTTEVDCEKTR